MIKKKFSFEIKEATQTEGIAKFTGYASTFGNVDYDNDIISKGAFAKSLKAKGQVIPILLDHKAGVMTHAGWNVSATEDEKGLMVQGELNTETEAGRTAYSIIKHAASVGAPMGLSIGVIIKDYDTKSNKGVRIIKEAELHEYSVVVFPANSMASVTAVKNLKDKKEIAIKKREIEQALRDVGCSKSECLKAISQIFSDEPKPDTSSVLDFLSQIN